MEYTLRNIDAELKAEWVTIEKMVLDTLAEIEGTQQNSISIEDEIIETYRNNNDGVRGRIAIIRNTLSHYSRSELDAAMSGMQRKGQLTFIPMEYPEDVNSEDREAAIDMGNNDKRYWIYIR